MDGRLVLVMVARHFPNVRTTAAELSGNVLRLHFPSGGGYQRQSVSFEW